MCGVNRMHWFRLYNEVLESKKIQRAARMAQEPYPYVLGVAVGLMVLASASPERGKLKVVKGGAGLTADEIAALLHDESGSVQKVLQSLSHKDVQFVNQRRTTYCINEWFAKQPLSDDETQNKRRYRKSRTKCPNNVLGQEEDSPRTKLSTTKGGVLGQNPVELEPEPEPELEPEKASQEGSDDDVFTRDAHPPKPKPADPPTVADNATVEDNASIKPLCNLPLCSMFMQLNGRPASANDRGVERELQSRTDYKLAIAIEAMTACHNKAAGNSNGSIGSMKYYERAIVEALGRGGVRRKEQKGAYDL